MGGRARSGRFVNPLGQLSWARVAQPTVGRLPVHRNRVVEGNLRGAQATGSSQPVKSRRAKRSGRAPIVRGGASAPLSAGRPARTRAPPCPLLAGPHDPTSGRRRRAGDFWLRRFPKLRCPSVHQVAAALRPRVLLGFRERPIGHKELLRRRFRAWRPPAPCRPRTGRDGSGASSGQLGLAQRHASHGGLRRCRLGRRAKRCRRPGSGSLGLRVGRRRSGCWGGLLRPG
jgi:hypothetical protein